MASVNYTGYDVDGNPVGGTIVVTETTPASQTKTALDAAMDLELQILSDIQSRLNQVHSVWSGNYLPCELTTLALVCNKAKQATDISYVAAQASAETSKQYAIAGNSITEQMNEACFTPDCNFDTRLAVAKARSESWKIQGALRFDETRVDVENASRINDKLNMIAPGRNGVVAAANSLMAVAKIYEEMAQQAAAAKDSDRYAQGRGVEMLKGLASNGKNLLSAFGKAQPATWDQASYDKMRFGETQPYNVIEDGTYGSNNIGQSYLPDDATFGPEIDIPIPIPVSTGMDLDF
jgi:hypothetical protein